MPARSGMLASLFFGASVALKWLSPIDQTESWAQRCPVRAVTWTIVFGLTEPKRRRRLAFALTGTVNTAANCRSRGAGNEGREAKSKKRESGHNPHFFHRAAFCHVPCLVPVTPCVMAIQIRPLPGCDLKLTHYPDSIGHLSSETVGQFLGFAWPTSLGNLWPSTRSAHGSALDREFVPGGYVCGR
jgi:hypothetical protein